MPLPATGTGTDFVIDHELGSQWHNASRSVTGSCLLFINGESWSFDLGLKKIEGRLLDDEDHLLIGDDGLVHCVSHTPPAGSRGRAPEGSRFAGGPDGRDDTVGPGSTNFDAARHPPENGRYDRIPGTKPEVPLGDLDDDQQVSGGGFAIVLAAWSSPGDSPADVDGDQPLNGGDLAIMLATGDSGFGNSAPRFDISSNVIAPPPARVGPRFASGARIRAVFRSNTGQPRSLQRMPDATLPPPARRSLILGFGFATATAMWALGYIAFMRPGFVLGEIVFGLELLLIVAGGIVAGRHLGTIRAGIWTGFVSATVNLMIIGSIVGSGSSDLVIWIAGLFAGSAFLGGIGAFIGRLGFDPERSGGLDPTGFFSLVAAATVFVLIVTGGLVTGMEAGLAVPDWPNSFGHNMLLYPLSEMTGGIFYEHAHRLYGMLVGLTSIVLLALVWIHDRRGWVRGFASVIFVMVCIQGLMGGLRVTGHLTDSQVDVQPSTVLAIAHGMFGQLTFAAFVALAALSSRRCRDESIRPARIPEARGDRTWSGLLLGAIILQLFLGACYRHLATPPLDGAPKPEPPPWAMHGHLTFSLAVVVIALVAGLRAKARRESGIPLVPATGRTVNALVGLQFLLGIIAFVTTVLRRTTEIPIWELVPTSAHQANGALLLAASAVLLVAVRRFEVPEPSPLRGVAARTA